MIIDRIGPYEIVSRLGEGGMGEVYRATDTNLKRQVAIKVLPESVADDPDRLARFQREAEVLAALNHPAIAAIYGLERAGGVMALVMELVEGPTLADMLAGLKPEARSLKPSGLPLPDALNIARQMAEALEAAHERGIIHRDLKPANIKVRPDGTVKVLDFGLAKAMEPASGSGLQSSGQSISPTITSPAMTQAGVILGTAAYMSPEQAAGKPVDKRTDLWSFGVVFLEMLTGGRVFDGETTSHVLAAVLKDAPDFSALPAETPAPIRRLLKRCLEKDRRKRLADAADARLEIEDALTPQSEPSSSPSIAAATPASSAWKRYAGIVAGFVAGALVAAAAAVGLTRSRSDTPPVRELTYTPLSFEPGGNNNSVWSPDGKGIAFGGRQREDEPFEVYVRYLDSSTAAPLTHLDGISLPLAWTTTGRIVFRSTATPSGLWSVSQTGGQAEPLLAVDDAGTSSATVSRDGSTLAYYSQQDGKYGVWISAPTGTPPKRYAPAPFEAELLVNYPTMQFSPDGRSVLLIRNATSGEEAWLLPYPPDANHPPRRIFGDRLKGSTGTPRFSWMPDNRRVLLSISKGPEPNRLYVADTASGEFSLLSSGTTMQVQPAVSPDGTRAAFSEVTNDFDVLQVDVGTGEVSPLVATTRNEEMPAWAMHAPAMAYVTDRAGAPEIWLHEPGRPDRSIVTAHDFGKGSTGNFLSPLLSPDGARIIYTRIEGAGGGALWLSSVGGGAPVRVTNTAQAVEFPGGWSPDGAWFVYWSYGADGTSVAKVRTTGNAALEILLRNVRPEKRDSGAAPLWSPAGDWILHHNDGWRLLSADGKTARDLGIEASVCTLSRDAADLYCVRGEGRGATLIVRRVAGGPERVIASLAPHQVPDSRVNPGLKLTWTPDGRHLTFSAARRVSSLWLLEGIGAPR